MTFLDPLLSNPLVPRLGWVLVHFVWQGTVIAALLGMAMLALHRRSANARYLAACTGLLLMVVALPVTMMFVPAPPASTPTSSVAPSPPPMVVPMEAVPPLGPQMWHPAAVPESGSMAPAPVEPRAEIEAKPLPPWYQRAARHIDPLLPWAVLVWLAGVCSLSVRLVAGWVVVQRLRRQLVGPVAEATQATLNRLARRLAVSRPVRIVESAIAQVPSVIGWLRPVILLPASALAGLTTQQLEAVIAHELAHIRRYDYLVNLIQSTIETILFYHPAVWWVSRRIRLEREHCCDDIAVAVCGNARAYARALSEMESLRAPRLAAAAGGGSLLERIRRLVGPRNTTHYQYGRFTAGLLVAAAVVAFVVLVQFSSPDALAGDKPQADPPTETLTAAHPAGERVLVFPADQAMGVLQVRDDRSYEQQYPGWRHLHAEWEPIGPARGEVLIPADKQVKLLVGKAAAQDLSPLAKLRPADLYALDFWNAEPEDEALGHLAGLTGLVDLSLRYAPITNAGLEHLKNLTSLKVLHLDGSSVTDDGLSHLQGLKRIEFLDLYGTKVTDEGLAHLSSLRSLKFVGLGGTLVSGDGLVHLKDLPALTDVSLSRTPVKDDALAHLARLAALQYLNLWNTDIGDEGLALLKPSPSLKRIELYSAKVTDAGVADLKRHKSLEYLDLRRNEGVTADALAHLAELPALKELLGITFRDNQQDLAKSLPKFSRLESLAIGGDGLTDEAMGQVARLTGLKKLEIEACPVGDAGLARLKEMKSLESLRLMGTRITGEGIVHLAALPKLEFIWISGFDPEQAGLTHFAGLKSLKTLLLDRTVIFDRDLVHLAGLSRLTELRLESDSITDDGVAHLAGLTGLEEFDLKTKALTDKSLAVAGRMTGLTRLSAGGTFTDAGLDHLKSLTRLRSLSLNGDGSKLSHPALEELASRLSGLQYFHFPANVSDERTPQSAAEPASPASEATRSPDFDLGIWNLPLRQFSRTYGDNGAFRVIDLDFPDIVPQVRPGDLGLSADASRVTAAQRAGKGDLVAPDAATLQPIRGCILAPLTLPPAEPGHQMQQIIYNGLKDKTLNEIAAEIQTWREEHPSEDAIRLEPGKHYAALRPDGALVVLGAHGEPDEVWVQFIPIGRLADTAVTSQPSSPRVAIWDPTIPALQDRIAGLERDYAGLIEQLGADHEAVQTVGAAVRTLQSALKELPAKPISSEADAKPVEQFQLLALSTQSLIDGLHHRNGMAKIVGPDHKEVQKLDKGIQSEERFLDSLVRRWRSTSSPLGDAVVRDELARLKLGLAVEHQKQMEALNLRENPAVSGPRMAGVQLTTAQCYRVYYEQFGFDPPAPFPRHAEEYETLRSRWENAGDDDARAAVVKELLARTDQWLAEAEANVEQAMADSKLKPSTARAAVEAGKTAFLAGKMANYPLPHAAGRIEPDRFSLEFIERYRPGKDPTFGTIAGVVTDKDGRPAADVTVYMTSAADDRDPVVIKTDETGGFRGRPLPPGRYFVAAFRSNQPPAGPASKDWKSGTGYVMGDRAPVEVKPGLESTVRLRPAGEESIAVTLARPGEHHLEWGVIFVARSPIDMDATAPPADLKLPPDLLGFFFVRPGQTVRIHNLPAGTIHLLATPSDPGPMGFSESTPVEIKPGEPAAVRLVLKPRSAADTTKIGPGSDDSDGQAAPAPDPRAAVQDYIDAALAGRDEDAAKLGPPRSAVGRQARDMREIGGPIQVERVYADAEAAFVVTSAVNDDRGRTGRLVFDVQRSDGGWLIHDMDFEDDEGAKSETEHFFRNHPEARPDEAGAAGDKTGAAPLLAFRVAPNKAGASRIPSLDPLRSYSEELEEHGPEIGRIRNDPFQWFEMADTVETSPNATIATWQGRRYMLLCAHDFPLQDGVHPVVMSQGDRDQPAWNLKRVYMTNQPVIDRPAIGFELDEEGGRQLKKLTAANLNNDLAIVLAGKVISRATLRSEIGSHGMISGSFTRAQVDEIVAALKPSVPTTTETQPASDQALLEERIEELASQVRHPEETVRKQAVRELGELKDRRAVPALLEALKDAAWVVRSRAAGALLEISDERAVQPLIERLQQDDNGTVRARAAAALGKLPGEVTTQALVQALQDNDVRVRTTAARHLEAVQWETTNPANKLRQLLALGRRDEAAELAPRTEVSDDHRRAEGPLVFFTPTLVGLQSPAADSGYTAAIDWIEFIPTGDPVLVKLNTNYPSGPKAKWRALVTLLDADGRKLAEEGTIFENSGVIAGVPVTVQQMLEVNLGPQTDLLGATRFVVTFAPAKDEAVPDKSDLDPPAVLAGQVFDSDHRPIPDVKVHVYTGLATYFPLGETVTDAEGRYRLEIRNAAGFFNEAARRWDFTIGIRLEHPDYKSAGPDFYTRTIPGIAGRVTTCYFAMNPTVAASRPAPESAVARLPRNPSSRPAAGEGTGGPAGVVLLPDGQPAAGARVVLVRPAARQYANAARFLNGAVESAGSSLTVQTGIDGRFSFTEQEDPFRIVVVHDAGYGEATMEPTSFEKIALAPWGRVEGRLAIPGTEGHRQKIVLNTIRDDMQNAGLMISHQCETQTDEQGHFVLDRVVPRYAVVGREVTVSKARSASISLDHGVGADVRPGTTTRVTIGGTGRPVVGRLVPGEDVQVDFRQAFAYVYVQLNASPPRPPKDEAERRAWYERWNDSDEARAYQRAVNTRYIAPVNDDGTFRIEDLPADEYRVSAHAFKLVDGPAWGLGEPIGTFSDVIVIEDGPRDRPIILEDMELVPCKDNLAAAVKTVFVNATDVEPLAIYRVVEPAETRLAESVPLGALKLDSRPLITARNIVKYDWDTHTIKLTEAALDRLPARVPVQGIPFVVVVNGERCYLGAFQSALSSYLPKVPLIYGPKEIGQAADAIRIQAPPIQGTPDPRSDDRVKKVLESAGRLKRDAAAIDAAKSTPVAGKILDRNGRPIAGARVVLYHNLSLWGLDNRVVEETRSATDGTYAFKTPLKFEQPIPHAYAQDSFIVLATHADHALGWLNIAPGDKRPDYTLHLTEPQTQTVKVVDADDKPLEGVRVWVYGAGDPQGQDLLLRDYLFLPTDAGLIGATTSASGEAIVTNLPKTRCNFHAKLPGYAEGIAFHAGQTIRLSKGGTVAGRVLTTDEKPVAGAIVRFAAAWRYNFYALTRTDEQGRYRIEDLPAAGWDMSAWGSPPGSGTYRVTIHHDDYMTPTFDVAVEPGQVVEDMDIEALPGTLVVCKVVQPETNRPLPGVRLMGFNDQDRINGYTDADGIFKVRVLGGRTWIEFQSPPDNMYTVEPEDGGRSRSRVEFDADDEQMDVTITAPAGMGFITSARGTVVDADGKPVAGARVWAQPAGRLHGATGPACTPETATDAEGRFELARAPAGTDLCFYVETPDRRLAGTGVFEIGESPDATAPIRIQLRPTASVDMILRDPKRGNEPVRDKHLQVWPRVGEEDMWRTDRTARTDADGRLKLDGILPGLEYSLRDAVYDSMDRPPIDPKNPPYQDRLELLDLSR